MDIANLAIKIFTHKKSSQISESKQKKKKGYMRVPISVIKEMVAQKGNMRIEVEFEWQSVDRNPVVAKRKKRYGTFKSWKYTWVVTTVR